MGKTDDVALSKEVLDVSCSQITVDYDFVNESKNDVTSRVVFPLPPYPSNPSESGVIANGQPDHFTVQVNGQPVPFKTKVHATLNGKDVTETLKSIGFSDQQIASFPFDKSLLDDHVVQVPRKQLDQLQKAGLTIDAQPLWDIHVDYEWMQTFPAKTTVHVMHRYQPFVAIGTAGGYYKPNSDDPVKIGDADSGRFCLSDEQKSKLNTLLSDKKNRDVYDEIPGTIVDYVLMTANTWKDGIRDFQLRVHTSADSVVAASCYPPNPHVRFVAPAAVGRGPLHRRQRIDPGLHIAGTTKKGTPE